MLTVKGLACVAPEVMYITFASAMRIGQPTLALKPKGNVTRNPKQGDEWPQNRTYECIRQKNLKNGNI